MTAVSQVPQQLDWTCASRFGDWSSICERHSATRLPVSQAGPIGPRPTAAGKLALLIVPPSAMRSKQRISPPADHGMSPARICSSASITPPRMPA